METSSGPPSQKPKVTVAAPVPTTQLDPSAAKEESRQGRPTPDAAAPDVLIPRAGKRGTRIGGAAPLDSKNPSFVDEKREEAEDRQNESLAKDTPDLESKEGAGFRFWQPAYFWFWFMITSLVLVSTSRCALSRLCKQHHSTATVAIRSIHERPNDVRIYSRNSSVKSAR